MDTRSLDVTISGVGTVIDDTTVVSVAMDVGPNVFVGLNVGAVIIAVGAYVVVGANVGPCDCDGGDVVVGDHVGQGVGKPVGRNVVVGAHVGIVVVVVVTTGGGTAVSIGVRLAPPPFPSSPAILFRSGRCRNP